MQTVGHVKAHLQHPWRVHSVTLSAKKVTEVSQARCVCAADLAQHLSSSRLALTAVDALAVL